MADVVEGLSRRRLLVAGAGALAACAGCAPDSTSGFGGEVDIGGVDELDTQLIGVPWSYHPEARAWLVRYPAAHLDRALEVYDASLHEGLRAGYLALWQKCPHLGCRVPECASSGLFECPCHFGRFSGVGEYREGPAPRGMDAFPLRIVEGRVLVDTGRSLDGLARDVDVTGQVAAGPSCAAPGS